ncbi:TPA: hypothetical protein OT818_000374 [Citrobacter koseri]|nr:hypothetical protein [Citrobacter koseri]
MNNKLTGLGANHPANGPLTTERLIHIRNVLLRNLQYSMDYIIADSVKAIDELLEVRKAEPVGYYRKGSDGFYFASPTEQRPGTIPLYRHAQPAPVDNTFIPKNLDRALGVVGVALPESKEEFNFQIERWIQRLIDRVIRYSDEFKEQTAQPDIEMLSSALRNAPLATVVPDEWTIQDAVKFCRETGRQDAGSAMDAWNACRAAMLQGDKS